jgi:hypothetical protein
MVMPTDKPLLGSFEGRGSSWRVGGSFGWGSVCFFGRVFTHVTPP